MVFPNITGAVDGSTAVIDGPPVGSVTVELDEAALDVARSAAVAEAGDADLVGDAVDAYAEDPVAVTARFQALVPGYRGWLWSVTIALLEAAPPAGDEAPVPGEVPAEPSCTVSEVALLPGPDALLAPPWVPWEQRIRSGDLGVGDLLPTAPDDPRLVPAYLLSDDPAVEQVAHELGIGRVRVMSRDGRVDAADRWHDGSFGPGDEMAAHAPGHCATCGFYLPLAGSLGAAFGACGNELSPADGRVVDAGYGCGAHSEAIGQPRGRAAVTDTVIDELQLEVHARPGDERGELDDPGEVGDAGEPGEPGDAGGPEGADSAPQEAGGPVEEASTGDDDAGVTGDAATTGDPDAGDAATTGDPDAGDTAPTDVRAGAEE